MSGEAEDDFNWVMSQSADRAIDLLPGGEDLQKEMRFAFRDLDGPEPMPEVYREAVALRNRSSQLGQQFRNMLGSRDISYPGEGVIATRKVGGTDKNFSGGISKGELVDPNTGSHPEVSYRYEGPEGVEAMRGSGFLGSKFGVSSGRADDVYTHTSAVPDRRYAERGSRLLEVEHHNPAQWRRKDPGHNATYAVTDELIPEAHVKDVTHSYDGPYAVEPKNDPDYEVWDEPRFAPDENVRRVSAAKADTAREVADQYKHGLVSEQTAESVRDRLKWGMG